MRNCVGAHAHSIAQLRLHIAEQNQCSARGMHTCEIWHHSIVSGPLHRQGQKSALRAKAAQILMVWRVVSVRSSRSKSKFRPRSGAKMQRFQGKNQGKLLFRWRSAKKKCSKVTTYMDSQRVAEQIFAMCNGECAKCKNKCAISRSKIIVSLEECADCRDLARCFCARCPGCCVF